MIRGKLWALCLLFLSMACKRGDAGHDHDAKRGHQHAEDHPAGHDHHAEGHGHEEETVGITLWGDRHELFAEHPRAVAGRALKVLAHVTVLNGFKPLEQGEVSFELNGPAELRGVAAKPTRPGIYELELTPPAAGTYRGRLSIQGPHAGVVEGVEIEVLATPPKKATAPEQHDAGEIEFLKEQQWGVPFATEPVKAGTVVPAVEVAGTVTTPPSGSAEVSAPIVGRLVMPAAGLARPGDAVTKGQLLATLAPAPAAPEEAARASLAVMEAEARAAAAGSALQRAERLIKDQAISERELEEARRESTVAAEAVQSAKRAKALFAGATAGTGAGAWRLVSPIAGSVVEVRGKPGATVAPREVLFRIVDPSELWLRGRVPEQDIARLRPEQDAAYQPTGVDAWLPIAVSGDKASASLISVGRVVDESSRTVDIIYSLKLPDARLRVGGLVRLSLPAGEAFRGVIVPKSAVVSDEGRSVVYVQVDAEHFAQRTVRLGPAAAGLVAVEHGLDQGQRIVTQGANLVRLAGSKGSRQPHGHIH
ncbi:MAG TPA: efflux RND transporter periplasmic adaptor subunit [Polyangiaceae bacterium]|nr:efflux RND transporter periplasmic adaptor subunit [Polyangiaceae bacterium]